MVIDGETLIPNSTVVKGALADFRIHIAGMKFLQVTAP